MAISNNPTKTRTIERAWLREVGRRFSELAQKAAERLRAQADGQIVVNQFDMDRRQQRVYLAWLEDQIDTLILVDNADWQTRYQLEAYRRGLEQTRAALISQGAPITPTEGERLAAQGLSTFSAAPALATGAAAAPIHQEALAFLQGRAFDKLKGWTDDLAAETRQVLFDGVVEGKPVEQVIRDLRKRIDVTKSRAEVIARTEINQAYSRATTAEAQRVSDEIGEPVRLRWLSVRDSKVRPLHRRFHGQIMTPEEAQRKKGISPWNCRCGFAPVIEEADTQAKREKFAAERKQLLDEAAA